MGMSAAANNAGVLPTSIWRSQMCQRVDRPDSCMLHLRDRLLRWPAPAGVVKQHASEIVLVDCMGEIGKLPGSGC